MPGEQFALSHSITNACREAAAGKIVLTVVATI
jgi:hypothetical protein